jgi:hypothetical protein
MVTVNCICEHCNYKSECDFYAETTKPCIEVVQNNFFDTSEPFIACLIRNLNEFECEDFEKGN